MIAQYIANLLYRYPERVLLGTALGLFGIGFIIRPKADVEEIPVHVILESSSTS